MASTAGLIGLGLAAGILSGFMGIGGGVIVIPALIYFFGMSQRTAQGTTLFMMLPPIGILAAMEYLRRGEADWKAAAWICLGFLLGGYGGAWLTTAFSDTMLRRFLGLFLALMGLRMLWKP